MPKLTLNITCLRYHQCGLPSWGQWPKSPSCTYHQSRLLTNSNLLILLTLVVDSGFFLPSAFLPSCLPASSFIHLSILLSQKSIGNLMLDCSFLDRQLIFGTLLPRLYTKSYLRKSLKSSMISSLMANSILMEDILVFWIFLALKILRFLLLTPSYNILPEQTYLFHRKMDMSNFVSILQTKSFKLFSMIIFLHSSNRTILKKV